MSHERDLRPHTLIRPRRLPGIVLLCLAVPAVAALLVLRRDLVVEIGLPGWLAAAIAASALVAWTGVRLWRPLPLIDVSPTGIGVPALLREPLAWSDIRRIEAITHRHRGGDIADRLLIHLKQPMELNWRPGKLRKIFAGLPQTAVGIDLGMRWPMRADALRDVLHDAARDFAAGNGARSDTQPRRSRAWAAPLAMAVAACLPVALQLTDVGPPRFFSAGLALYAEGKTAAALPLLEADARSGDAQAAVALGAMYLNGDGVERNPSMSAAWYGRAAEAGDPAAAYHLGTAYRLGLGVPADLARAIAWYEVAAKNGYAEAAFALSRLYRLGDGVRRDYGRAIDWLKLAVDKGFAPAMQDLGQLYYDGLGVPRDQETAKTWYRRAADAGLVAARYDLARVLLDGAPDQRQQGMRYLAEAAEYGYAPAQRRLAVAYAFGPDVPVDLVAAFKWMTLAERAWPAATRADLVREKARIQTRMTDTDVAAATDQVRLWKPLRAD